MSRCLKTIQFCLLLISTQITFSAVNEWTGAAGDYKWENPANWSQGYDPVYTDDVVIPEGTPVCKLDFCAQSGHVEVNGITNRGSLYLKGDAISLLRINTFFWNYGSVGSEIFCHIACENGELSNWGTITCDGNLTIIVEDLANFEGASIEASNELFILAKHDVVNEGTIRGITHPESRFGGSVRINCNNLDNWGAIQGGNTLEGATDYLNTTGQVTVHAFTNSDDGGNVRNHENAVIAPGANPEGAAKSTITGGNIILKGKNSESSDKKGDSFILAESVELDQAELTASLMLIAGDRVKLKDIATSGIHASEDFIITIGPPGTLDFSGIDLEDPISADSGSVYIFADNIVPPTGGLGWISNPDPLINPGDTTWTENAVSSPHVFEYAGSSGVREVAVQNLGTGTNTYTITIESDNGWGWDATDENLTLAPFQTGSKQMDFNIPENSKSGESDSVIIIIRDWRENIADTTFGVIYSLGTPPVTSVTADGGDRLPGRFELYQNYPNPFNPVTTINYSLKSPSHVNLRLFDLQGREVAVFLDEDKQAGAFTATIDAGSLASGIYYYKIRMNDFIAVKKMIVME